MPSCVRNIKSPSVGMMYNYEMLGTAWLQNTNFTIRLILNSVIVLDIQNKSNSKSIYINTIYTIIPLISHIHHQ